MSKRGERMRVVVLAHGEARRYLLAGQPERAVDLPRGATLAELVTALGASPDDALLARRDGAVIREAAALAEGDRVELFLPVGGG
ncbi:MAG TPA: MoaD/ThiS family protein [Ktedonobacterales bacterium]